MKATIRHGAGLAAVVFGLGVVAAGCLTRPVEHQDPTTQTNVSIQVPNQAVDKIDMLFDIDNSASMGDKQQFLALAIPELITRLVTPNCIDDATPPNILGTVNGGVCAQGKPEFQAVHDMHLGIVTSSLGTRLSDQGVVNNTITPTKTDLVLCSPTANTAEFAMLSAHNDDKGELISRTLSDTGVETTPAPDAPSPSNYLYYFPTGTPTGPVPPTTSATQLQTDFGDIVHGAGIFGCGIESQMESWYRFLIQPDPYASLQLNPPPSNCTGNSCYFSADWAGVDTTIIQQRHDFLRPDSLVVIVVLSDENDSEIDVRSLHGTGYLFMHEDWNPPQATAGCANAPDDPTQCMTGSGTYSAQNDWGFDPNLRHVHMLQKYGVDPQYPIGRYYVGLTQSTVPDRRAEYPGGSAAAGSYQGCLPSASNSSLCVPNCTNPLFAATLPVPDSTGKTTQDQLCNLPVGQRANQKTNIFYAHIGGVPNQLLHFNPNDLTASQLNDQDWVRILGKGAANFKVGDPNNPLKHDYTGIDPHMIESYQDRTKDPLYTSKAVDTSVTNIQPSTATNTADPVSGREWVTDQPIPTVMNMVQIGHVLPVDREYACTFPLAQARDCTLAANENSCDCPQDATGLTPAQIPPLCDPNKPTSQVSAKAYPTIRELLLARLMGTQGIVASLCPIHATPQGTGYDPEYGYNPAVAVIVDRLKTALNSQCLPEKLGSTDGGAGVPCLVLVTLPPGGAGTCKNPVCDATKGLFGPGVATNSVSNPPLDQDVLDKFCDQQEAKYTGIPGALDDPANQSVCLMYELTASDPNAGEFTGGSCSNYMPPGTTAPGGGGGWCYVTGSGAGGCPQAVQFSEKSPPAGSITYLQCIEESISVVNASGK